jgi:hypothetical protein
MMDETRLLLTLLQMEKRWQRIADVVLDKGGIDLLEPPHSADLPICHLILEVMGFGPDRVDLLDALDPPGDDWDPAEMLVWLRGEQAKRRCNEELDALLGRDLGVAPETNAANP